MLHMIVEHFGEINKFFPRLKAKRKQAKLKESEWVFHSIDGEQFCLTKTQNNVSPRPFTNAVSIYKVKLIFPLSPTKIRVLNLLEFEIEKNDRQHFKTKKITHAILKAINWSVEFGALQLIKELWIFQVLEK